MAYKYESISFRTTQEDKRKLEALAESKTISTSVLIRDIIHQYVNDETPQRKQNDEMMKCLQSLPDSNRIEGLENVIVKYLQQILYHSFRADMWNIECTKKVHKGNLSNELDQEVEDLVKRHSAKK